MTIIWPDPGAEYEPLLLPDKLSALEKLIDDNDVGLLIIDPLHSHISPKFKIENDQHMKAALQPLTKIGQAKGIPILAVRHTTKAKTGLALTAGLGSISTIASARSRTQGPQGKRRLSKIPQQHASHSHCPQLQPPQDSQQPTVSEPSTDSE